MSNKFFQFLGLTKKSGNLLEGYNKCEEDIKKGKISLIIISIECSQNTKDKFKNCCEKINVPIIDDLSKYDLGSAIGRNELNVAGVSSKRMSQKLISIYKEND